MALELGGHRRSRRQRGAAARLIQQLRDDSRLFRQHSQPHRQTDKHFEHSVIIRALRNKDVEGGRWAMRAVMGSVGPILRRLPDAVAFGFRHQSLRVLGKQARAGRQRQPDANTDAIARLWAPVRMCWFLAGLKLQRFRTRAPQSFVAWIT